MMPASITALKSVRTTAEILAATAELPLHLWPHRGQLEVEPVSAASCWGDRRWILDNKSRGASKSQSSISWDLDLPDGSNLLDPQNADFLDFLRRLVWSLSAAPGDGYAALKSGTLGSISSGLRYWAAWLVAREIRWPHEITESVIKQYQEHLQGGAEDDVSDKALTEAVASARLLPFALLWRQRFALERAGIAPMPAAPFGRAGVIKIANQIAAVATGSYRPLPDEVAIPVLNRAMAMLGSPAADVISLVEACATAYSSGLAENVGSYRRQFLAETRQPAAARAFRFAIINGRPWHPPLDPGAWDTSLIAAAEQKTRSYLDARRCEWAAQMEEQDIDRPPERRPTLPTYRCAGADHLDLRRVILDLGLTLDDQQLLCRHPKLHALLSAAALEQGLAPVPLINVMQRVRQLVLAIRSAAHIVIQATTGMRISEVCGLKAGMDEATGLPRSIMLQDSLDGLTDIFIVNSDLSKTEDMPKAVDWVLGYRPKGSAELPPAVQAIIILDQLLAPWRALLDTDDLFISFSNNRGLPKTIKSVRPITTNALRDDLREFVAEWVDLTSLPDEAERKTGEKDLVPYRESHGRIIKTHQLRKSFGYFAANIDRRLLPMLQMNFHHVSTAMTDGAYTGNPIFEQDVNDVRRQDLAFVSLDTARGASGMAGRYGEGLEQKIVHELGARVAGLSAEDAYFEAFIYVEEAGITRLFFEPYGICGALSASEMSCHEVGGTADVARWEPRLTPNYQTRQPSLCAGCACFAIARRHRPYWETRYIDNAAQLRTFEALGHKGSLVDRYLLLAEAQAQQSLAICRKLGSDMDDLECRLAAEVAEALNAT
jgi:integrase